MRRQPLLIGLAGLVGLWLVLAVFVAVYEGTDPNARGDAAGWMSTGYKQRWSVETWEGEDEATADKERIDSHVERGPLDRQAGTFRFAISYSTNRAQGLEGLRLYVTSAGDWGDNDETAWTQVAEAHVSRPGAERATLICEAVVSASTTAYQVSEVRDGVPCCGFSRSMLAAPTTLGRVYDAIAWRPFFNWVPDLR